mgnify:CR=1 FL=1
MQPPLSANVADPEIPGESMTARILDGKIPASRIFDQIRARVSASSITPGLAVIQVGSDPASTVYVNMKEKRCSECGILSRVFRLPDSTAQEDLLDLVRQLNADPAIHGILVQSPLPGHIDEFAVIETVSPLKDADCFHPCNIGRLVAGAPLVHPCTPAGALHILRYYGIDPAGKRALVVGRSNIVGKPLGLMLLAENASVGWAHSKTRNLASLCREAEILCVAVGKPGCITADMVSEGAIVVDVGINRVARGESSVLVGDVDFEGVGQKAAWITPVPGGVGAMTIAMLLSNCLRLAGIPLP